MTETTTETPDTGTEPEPNEDGETTTETPEPGDTPAPETDEPEDEPGAKASRRSRRAPREPEGDPAEVQARKLETANRNYLKDVGRIVGAETIEQMSTCPYCDGLALVPNEKALNVRDDTEACRTCGGLGYMITGSHVPEHAVLPCPTCSSTGYVYKQTPVDATETTNVTPLPTPQAQVHGWFDPVTQTFHPYGEDVSNA